MSLSPESTANLARRLVAIADAKAELDAEADQIKNELRSLGAGTHAAGDYKVTVTTQRRFDASLAQQILDETTYTSLCTAFDSKKAKATLPPALYDTLMTESGEPRITVK
jgi:hypothetical protein